MARISRPRLCGHVRPDHSRQSGLADTDLWVEVEKDFTVYGDEVKFGGGKVIRDGMAQSQATQAEGAADTVITNVADPRPLGHRQSRRRAITNGPHFPASARRATRTRAGRHHHRRAGHGSDRRRGKILTAGGIDKPHPLHLPAAGGRGDRVWDHHPCRRRHRACDGHVVDEVYSRAVDTTNRCRTKEDYRVILLDFPHYYVGLRSWRYWPTPASIRCIMLGRRKTRKRS